MKIDIKIGKSTVQYDTKTGFFVWLYCHRKPFMNGKRAEHKTLNGYLYIKANKKNHSASRLAYFLSHDEEPGAFEIDHINRNKQDNRASNLRLVTREEQLKNRKFKKNTVGITGVSLHKKSGLFRARYKNKTTYHKTAREAGKAYKAMLCTAP